MVAKKRSYAFFITITAVAVLDQLTKFIVKNFNIPLTKNTGSLWGLFPGSTLLLIWFSIIVIGIFLYNYDRIQKSDILCRISSGLIVGGALGNLVDRIAYGAVVDFIDLGWWPSFNIADSAISVGVILLAYSLIKKEKSM